MEKEEILTSTYELTLLVSPDLSEFDDQKVADKVKTMVIGRNGQIIKEHTWGKKRLAYPIKTADFGYYFTIIFTLAKESINELSHDISLVPEVIRHLSLSLEKEGVTIDQLFTPEKEVALIAAMMKEKAEPKAKAATRATRRSAKILHPVEPAPANEPVIAEPEAPLGIETTPVETVINEADAADRLKALDEKLDQIFKEE